MLTFSSDTIGLAEGTTIVVRVKAENEIGNATNYSPVNSAGATVKTEPLPPLTPPSEGSGTSESQIEVNITKLPDSRTGGSSVTSYDIYWDNGSSEQFWIPLANIIVNGSDYYQFTQATGIDESTIYHFKYRANNLYGSGNFSESYAIKASHIPAQMARPTIEEVDLNVKITWVEPDDRGDNITKYRITFYDYNSSAYVENTTLCDGEANVNTLTCTLTMSSFGTVFSYTKGQVLLVQVEAYNVNGYSIPSPVITTGLVFKTEPIAPTNLNGTSTANDTILLEWDDMNTSPSNGYSDITEYEVWYDNAAGGSVDLSLNASAGTATNYSISGLSVNSTYRFAIVARNKYGPSPQSTELQILSAFVPSQMSPVNTSEVNTGITFTWEIPSDIGGTEVTAYRVNLLNKNTNEFTEYQSL